MQSKANILCAMVVVIAWLYSRSPKEIPLHLLGHKLHFEKEILDDGMRRQLMNLVKEMGVFPTNLADQKFYKAERDNIGEAEAAVGRQCSKPFLSPSPTNSSRCVLPGRIDVGRHYVTRGGVEGLRESYESLVSRVQSFGRYMFDLKKYKLAEELFTSEKFQRAAKTVCPDDKQFLDPFQFNFIIQVPGQTVAMHLDAPYFWGASRFEFPQWLLAVMVFSGLFRERFVNQVQVVAYVHEWRDRMEERAGEFYYWDDPARPKHLPPLPGAGISVDGVKTVHAASVYFPAVQAPILPVNKDVLLEYRSVNDSWDLTVDGSPVRNYPTSDLRISVVYRAKCFMDAAEAHEFRNQPKREKLGLDFILDRLKADLVQRGRLREDSNLSRYELSLLLLDEYVAYPGPVRRPLLPFNYCLLPKLFPSTHALLAYFCPH